MKIATYANVRVSNRNPRAAAASVTWSRSPFAAARSWVSASAAARKMVDEVRRQFREILGLLEGKVLPDYKTCIEISSKGAIRRDEGPVAACGRRSRSLRLHLRPEFVGGVIIGSTVCAIMTPASPATPAAPGTTARSPSKRARWKVPARAAPSTTPLSSVTPWATRSGTLSAPASISSSRSCPPSRWSSARSSLPTTWRTCSAEMHRHPSQQKTRTGYPVPVLLYDHTCLTIRRLRRFAARHGGLVALVHLADGLVDDILRGLRQVDADDRSITGS